MHLDVMDGHFVDNISFGPTMIQAVHETNDIFLDVHLMITRPDHFLPRFIEAGADLITVHVEDEADHDVSKTLAAIRAAGCKAGLALNPATPFEKVEPFLSEIDLLLVMTVVPGFGGQSFMEDMMPKVQKGVALREEKQLSYHIQVDGGVDTLTAPLAGAAGANVFVAGSSTYGAEHMAHAVTELRKA